MDYRQDHRSRPCAHADEYHDLGGGGATFLWREIDLVCFQDRLDVCEQAVRRLSRFTTTTPTTTPSRNDVTSLPPTATSSIPKANVNAKRPTNIAANLRDLIRAANAWDVQLYDWARGAF
jgi:hypothetical protein